jgi:hypothetical protein
MMASDIFWLKYKLHSIDGEVNVRYAPVLLDRRPQSSKCRFLRTGTCSLLTLNNANAYSDEALHIQSKWDSRSAQLGNIVVLETSHPEEDGNALLDVSILGRSIDRGRPGLYRGSSRGRRYCETDFLRVHRFLCAFIGSALHAPRSYLADSRRSQSSCLCRNGGTALWCLQTECLQTEILSPCFNLLCSVAT